MSGSPAEREIRDATVAFVRPQLAGARIVHELVVGGRRADLAVVTRDRILLFEIKSERDTLDRLDGQLDHFTRAAHGTILVAHHKWFDTTPYDNGNKRIVWPSETDKLRASEIWAYPESALEDYPTNGFMYRWRMPKPTLRQPRAWDLLGLLWRAELSAEANRHRISHGSRATVSDLIEMMAWHMTGREIAEAVCRQLRARPFPEADPPIVEHREAMV